MRDFFQDNKETLQIIAGIVIAIAGFVLVILRKALLGLILIFGGLILFCYVLSRILRSGGYDGESVSASGAGGLKGMGRQQSEAARDPNAGAVSDKDASIWAQMTDGR